MHSEAVTLINGARRILPPADEGIPRGRLSGSRVGCEGNGEGVDLGPMYPKDTQQLSGHIGQLGAARSIRGVHGAPLGRLPGALAVRTRVP
jgi:hypothetical protein